MTEEQLAKRIAGEITLSDKPWLLMKKWREIFEISQIEIALKMGISPSVISDYEGGRRSPGSKFIKNYVIALMKIDKSKGGKKIKEFTRFTDAIKDAIIDIREYLEPVTIEKLCEKVIGEIVVCNNLTNRKLFGHTIIDSIKCIETLSGTDFFILMGTNSMRAIIFTNVSMGRSPMVAIRVHPIKPAAVVIHGTQKVDKLAVKLASIEQIPLILSHARSVEEIINNLKDFL